MKKSWIKLTASFVSGILLTTFIILLCVIMTYDKTIRDTVSNENTINAKIYNSSMENRLKLMQEHINDILINIYNYNSFYDTEEEMDFLTLKKFYDIMDNKIMISSDIDAFFLYDIRNGQYLYRIRNGSSNSNIYQLKGWIRENCISKATTFKSPKWDIVDISGTGYYYKGIQMGKYIVGIASRLDNYTQNDIVNFIGKETTAFLVNNENSYCLFGNASLSSLLRSDAEPGYYIISSCEQTFTDYQLVIVADSKGLGTGNPVLLLLLVLGSLICFALAGALGLAFKEKIKEPSQLLLKASQEISKGNLDYRLNMDDAGSEEFEQLFAGFNEMSSQIQNLKIEAYDMKLTEEENKLRLLRAQVRPHTFLNEITTVSNLTYTHSNKEIRSYLNQFARFVRYKLQLNNEWTKISDELDHIQNYIELQRIKSPTEIEYDVYCPEEIKGVQIPFLSLYSLVENSFKHSLTLNGETEIFISCTPYKEKGFKGVKLVVEDNGRGFSEESLMQLDAIMKEKSHEAKEHVGLSNIIYTLDLLYHRNDLLRVSNREFGGAHVELLIPEDGKQNETTNM